MTTLVADLLVLPLCLFRSVSGLSAYVLRRALALATWIMGWHRALNAYTSSLSHTVPVQGFSQDQLAQPNASTSQESDDIWQQVCRKIPATGLP